MSKDINKLIPIKKAVFDYRKGIILRTYYISPEKYLKELLKIRTQLQPVYYKLHNNLKIALYNNDLISLKKELGLTNSEYEFLLKSLIEYKQRRYINSIIEDDKKSTYFLNKLNSEKFKADKLQYLQNSWFNFSLTNEDKKFIKENELNIRTKFIKPLSEFITFTPQYKYKEIKYKLTKKNIKVNKKQIKKSSLKNIQRTLEQINTISKNSGLDLIDVYKEFKKVASDNNKNKSGNDKDNSKNSKQSTILKDYFFSLTIKPEQSINPYITGKEISKIINFINLTDGKFITWLFSFIPQNKPIEDNQKHQLKNMFFGIHYYMKDKQFYSSLLNKVILDTLDFYTNELFENPEQYNKKYIVDFYNTFWQILILYKLDKLRFLSIVNNKTFNDIFNGSLHLIYELVRKVKEFDRKSEEYKEMKESLLNEIETLINTYSENPNYTQQIFTEVKKILKNHNIDIPAKDLLSPNKDTVLQFLQHVKELINQHFEDLSYEMLFSILDTLNQLKERFIKLFSENGINEHYFSDFIEFVNIYNTLAFISKNMFFLRTLYFNLDFLLEKLIDYTLRHEDNEKFNILKKSILLRNLRTNIDKDNSFVLDYLIWLDLNFQKQLNTSYLFFKRFIEPYITGKLNLVEVFRTVDLEQYKEIEPIYVVTQFLYSKLLRNIPEFPYEKNILFRLKPTWNPYSTYIIIRVLRDVIKEYGKYISYYIENNLQNDLRNIHNIENSYIVLYRERLSLLNYYELKQFNSLEEIKEFKYQNPFARIYSLKDIVDMNFGGDIEKVKGIYKNLILFFNIRGSEK
jgi:hypothetical protein